MKTKTKIVIIAVLASIAIIVFAVGCSLLNSENEKFKGISFIYDEHQFVSQYENEQISVSFLLVDSGEYFKYANENSAKMKLISSDNTETDIDTYSIETLKSSSFLSTYSLHKITAQFNPQITGDQIVSYFSLKINENSYNIGELTIQSCVCQDYPDIGIGSSPFSENYKSYGIMVTNREESPVTIKGIYYTFGSKETNLITSDLVVAPGEQKDLTSQTGFANKRYTIQPIIEYEYNGKIYKDILVVPTKYTTSLSRDEILKYIEETGQ